MADPADPATQITFASQREGKPLELIVDQPLDEVLNTWRTADPGMPFPVEGRGYGLMYVNPSAVAFMHRLGKPPQERGPF